MAAFDTAAFDSTNAFDEAAFDFAAGDTTAPILSGPTVAVLSDTVVFGEVDTDEGNGTMYWVVTTTATSPSAAQVRAGQDHLGDLGQSSGNTTVFSAGTLAQYAGGLTASTSYYMHWHQRDAALNDSNVVTSAQFTTNAVGTDGFELHFRDAQYRNRLSWGLN